VPGWREDAVGLRCGSVWPTVRGQGEFQPSNGFLKGNVGKNRIGADAHDLGVQLGKLRKVLLECREFVLSNGCEVKGIESDNHSTPLVIGKFKISLFITQRRLQIEIRRGISDLQWHVRLLFRIRSAPGGGTAGD
jgi:hypothetical protein